MLLGGGARWWRSRRPCFILFIYVFILGNECAHMPGCIQVGEEPRSGRESQADSAECGT